MNWLQKHEVILRTLYRTLTVVLLVACLWRIEVSVDTAGAAEWEAEQANINADDAAQSASAAKAASEEALEIIEQAQHWR